MSNKPDLLYYATGAWFILTLLLAVYFLFKSTVPPSNTVTPSVYSLTVKDIQPGTHALFKVGDVPITVWRRSYEQKVQALEQLGFQLRSKRELLQFIRTHDEFELTQDRILNFEWFVVSPVNSDQRGCVVIPDAGSLNGFYDYCENTHFDLWGRAKTEEGDISLHVFPWALSDDRSMLTVDVSSAPERR